MTDEFEVGYAAIELRVIERLKQIPAEIGEVRDPDAARTTRERVMRAAEADGPIHPSITGRLLHDEGVRSLRTTPPHQWNYRHPAVRGWNNLSVDEIMLRMDAVLERQCDHSPE
jgi:hypothetical protein